MKFPEEYIEREEKILHSGQVSNIFYNVNRLFTNDLYFRTVLLRIPSSDHYIGIATGGALIAMACHAKYFYSKFSMVRDGKLIGEMPTGQWILIDDVTTTGRSLLEAMATVGSQPHKIIVAVDRRPENKNPEVISLFQI